MLPFAKNTIKKPMPSKINRKTFLSDEYDNTKFT